MPLNFIAADSVTFSLAMVVRTGHKRLAIKGLRIQALHKPFTQALHSSLSGNQST